MVPGNRILPFTVSMMRAGELLCSWMSPSQQLPPGSFCLDAAARASAVSMPPGALCAGVPALNNRIM